MRCEWGAGDTMRDYHDREWGRPVTDERGLFEKLCLEAFQSGLSWAIILRKREGFRRAFAAFEPEAVAAFGPGDVERLLADEGIVRNRAKIEAAVQNARAVVALREDGRGLVELAWSHAPESGATPGAMGEIPAATTESKALAKELKARGFRFVGPTTAYAMMQACGLVNDHVAACFVREEVEAERTAARARLAAAGSRR